MLYYVVHSLHGSYTNTNTEYKCGENEWESSEGTQQEIKMHKSQKVCRDMIWWWHHCKRQLATHNLLKNHNKIISGYKFDAACIRLVRFSHRMVERKEKDKEGKNGFDLIPTVQLVMLSNAHRFFFSDAIRKKNTAIVVISWILYIQ